MSETTRIARAVRTAVTGFSSVPVVYSASTIRGIFVQRPLEMEDELGAPVTVAGELVRVMRTDVPGIARGATLTVNGATRTVRDVHADRNGHSVTLVLAGGTTG